METLITCERFPIKVTKSYRFITTLILNLVSAKLTVPVTHQHLNTTRFSRIDNNPREWLFSYSKHKVC